VATVDLLRSEVALAKAALDSFKGRVVSATDVFCIEPDTLNASLYPSPTGLNMGTIAGDLFNCFN
jgi:hypothetical protein